MKPLKEIIGYIKAKRYSYLFIAPAIIILTVFVFFPIIASLILSFTEYDAINPPVWVGLRNYITLFTQDALFWKAVINTVIYVFFVVIFGLASSFLVAMALSKKIKFSSFFRTAYFLPTVTSIAAVAVVWRWLYAGDRYGIINYVFSGLLVQNQDWLMQTATTLPAIIVMSIWSGIGYNTIILLAGLQSIPDSIYEAASIDGTSPWQRFRYVTLPMLKPILMFLIVMSIINSFQVFEQVYIMTGATEYFGGVLYSGLTIVAYLYERGFQRLMLGYASSIAYVLFGMIFIVTISYLKLSKYEK